MLSYHKVLSRSDVFICGGWKYLVYAELDFGIVVNDEHVSPIIANDLIGFEVSFASFGFLLELIAPRPFAAAALAVWIPLRGIDETSPSGPIATVSGLDSELQHDILVHLRSSSQILGKIRLNGPWYLSPGYSQLCASTPNSWTPVPTAVTWFVQRTDVTVIPWSILIPIGNPMYKYAQQKANASHTAFTVWQGRKVVESAKFLWNSAESLTILTGFAHLFQQLPSNFINLI